MKLLSLSALLAISLFLSSCSKNNTPTPAAPVLTGSVTIGGAVYPTIIIGSKTWTSLNYTGGTGSLATADPTYGNYYTLAQAMLISLPTGWRIPTRADYNNLLSNFTSTKNTAGDYVGDITVANALASDTTHYKGLLGANNSSGFSAYAGGIFYAGLGRAQNKNVDAVFLSTTTGTQNTTSLTYFFAITNDNVQVGLNPSGYYTSIDYGDVNAYAYSLRFVKDN